MKKFVILCLIIFISFVQSYAQNGEWNTKKSTHFIVYYKGNLDNFVDSVIDKAEALYEYITDYLGFRRDNFWLWENRAKIYIYEDAMHYQADTSLPNWSSGCASAREKTIKTYPFAEGFFDTVLPHEMAHIIFREFVGFDNPNIPPWLDEGIAGYQERMRRSSAKRILKSAILDNNFINLEDLNVFKLDTCRDPKLVNIFYAEAMGIVDYLIKQFGQDSFLAFCRALRDKRTLNEALVSAFSFKDLKELNDSWMAYLKNY